MRSKKDNGKEFVEMHGYDTYDIVWRQYYPAIMRFQTQDPFAEKYYKLSPYTMCADNMVRYTDPDGCFIPIIIAAIAEAPEIYLLGAAVVASVTASIHHYQKQHHSISYSYESSDQAKSPNSANGNTNTSQTQAKAKTNSAQTTAAARAPKKPDDKKDDGKEIIMRIKKKQ